MKYFDFWFSEEGDILKSYGVEGVHYYVDENGEKQYVDELKNAAGGVPTEMRKLGSCEIGSWANVDAEIKGMTPEAAEGFKNYVDNKYQVKLAPTCAKTEEEQRVLSDKGTAVSTFMSEYLQHWTMGSKDIDATWDEYIAGLKSMGIDDVINVYQTSYDRAYK